MLSWSSWYVIYGLPLSLGHHVTKRLCTLGMVCFPPGSANQRAARLQSIHQIWVYRVRVFCVREEDTCIQTQRDYARLKKTGRRKGEKRGEKGEEKKKEEKKKL